MLAEIRTHKMKHLILEYTEEPETSTDISVDLRYSPELNLTINIKTDQPAIESLSVDTETLTRTHNEQSDSDVGSRFLETQTFTKIELEGTDRD